APPKFRPSTTNWTVPPGLEPMVGVTCAVKVSESPNVAEGSDDVTKVVVGSVVTVNGEDADAAASELVPASDAVTVAARAGPLTGRVAVATPLVPVVALTLDPLDRLNVMVWPAAPAA